MKLYIENSLRRSAHYEYEHRARYGLRHDPKQPNKTVVPRPRSCERTAVRKQHGRFYLPCPARAPGLLRRLDGEKRKAPRKRPRGPPMVSAAPAESLKECAATTGRDAPCTRAYPRGGVRCGLRIPKPDTSQGKEFTLAPRGTSSRPSASCHTGHIRACAGETTTWYYGIACAFRAWRDGRRVPGAHRRAIVSTVLAAQYYF
ncbi:hypothetical protein SEVIR_6G194750v4 [Setaria viridis]